MTWSAGTIVVENDRIRSANLLAPIEDLSGSTIGPADERATSPVISDTRGHRVIIEDFIRAIDSGGSPLCDGPEARRSVELVGAIYESSRTGQPVNLAGAKGLATDALSRG